MGARAAACPMDGMPRVYSPLRPSRANLQGFLKARVAALFGRYLCRGKCDLDILMLISVDAQACDFPLQRLSWDAEFDGRSRRARDSAGAVCQRSYD